MYVRARPTSSLEPTPALAHDLVAVDGTLLLKRGEALESVHIRLLSLFKVDPVFEVDGPEAIRSVRARHNVQEFPILSAPHDLCLAAPAVDVNGRVVAQSGTSLDAQTMQRLAHKGVERVTLHAAGTTRKETQQFLAARQRLARHAPPALAEANSTQAHPCADVVELIATKWIEVCASYAKFELTVERPERRNRVYDGDLAWLTHVRGRTDFVLILSIQRLCAVALASRTLAMPESQVTPADLESAITFLVNIFLEDAKESARQLTPPLLTGAVLPVRGRDAQVRLATPAFAFSIPLVSEFGWMWLIFGSQGAQTFRVARPADLAVPGR